MSDAANCASFIGTGSPQHSINYSSTPERRTQRSLSGLTMDSGLDSTSPSFKSPYQSPRKHLARMPQLNSTPIRLSPGLSSFQDGGIESKTNLIVNYLPQSMTNDSLRDLFRSIGEIENSKLCKHKDTKLSLGYGFVNYRSSEDAAKAVQQLNGRQIQNKMIKVSFARPSSQHIKNTNLYVAGLPKSFTNEEVKQLFGRIGKIISCRILHCKQTGISRGVAFVRFDTRNEAEIAVKRLNQTQVPGQSETITVKFANPGERVKKTKARSNENLTHFDEKSTLTQLAFSEMLQNYQKMNGVRHFGRSISSDLTNVQRGTMSAKPNYPVLISVTNLASNVTEKDIWEVFGPFGAVSNVDLRPSNDQSQDASGMATVTMPVYQDAVCAIMAIDQTEIRGRVVNVGFKCVREFPHS